MEPSKDMADGQGEDHVAGNFNGNTLKLQERVLCSPPGQTLTKQTILSQDFEPRRARDAEGRQQPLT